MSCFKIIILSLCISAFQSVSCTTVTKDIRGNNLPRNGLANSKVTGQDTRGLNDLVKQLKNERIKERFQAHEELVKMGKTSVPAMITLLREQDLELREAAADILGDIGPEAEASIPALINAIEQDVDGSLQRSYVFALRGIGKATIPALVKALRNQKVRVRIAAAEALSLMGTEARDVSQALHVALGDENDKVRIYAAATILSFNPLQEEAVLIINNGLRSSNTDVRVLTVQAIVFAKIQSRVFVPLLLERTRDDNSVIRTFAVRALVIMKDDSAETIKVLIGYIKNRNTGILERMNMAQALVNIGKPVVTMVIDLLNDQDDEIRSTAIEILTSIGPEAEEAISPLLSRLRSEAKMLMKAHVAIALARIGGGNVVPSIIGFLEDGDANIRYCAASTLSNIGPDAADALPILIKHLDDEESRVRSMVATAIGSIGICDVRVIEKLEERMIQDENGAVRHWAADAIKRLKDGGKCEKKP